MARTAQDPADTQLTEPADAMTADLPGDWHGPAARRLRIDSRRRWFPDLRAFLRAWQLVAHLSRRDITVRYRQTILGAVWIVAGPLMSAGLYSFVFGRVAKLSSGGDSYFAFSYAGLLGWNLFSDIVMGASGSLVANSALLTKIYFPRLVLPVSKVLGSLVNTGISFIVMVVLLLVYGVGFSVNLLLLPVWLLLAIVLAAGLGLALSAVAVLYRDVAYVTQVFIPLLLFMTPVAYSTNSVPRSLRTIYLLNPVATIVEGCRWSVLGHAHLSAWAVVYTVTFTLVVLVAGLVTFARLEWRFADVV